MTPADVRKEAEERVRVVLETWTDLERAIAYAYLNALGQRIGGIEHTIERLAKLAAK